MWGGSGNPRPATELPGFADEPDYPMAKALGTNEAGLIVGWSLEEVDRPGSECDSRALIWENSVKRNLGALLPQDPFYIELVAEAIRNAPPGEPLQVVGTDFTSSAALLWERDGDSC